MDFFDDLRDDEPFGDELSDEPNAELGDDDSIADGPGLSELEFVESAASSLPPEMPLSSVDWLDAAGAPLEPNLPPVPMPGARDPGFDFSMLIGSGFGEGFAEIPRPRQPRGPLPFAPRSEEGDPARPHIQDLLLRRSDPRSGIELLPYRPDRDRPHSMVLASEAKNEHDSSADLTSLPVANPSAAAGDYKPLGQPRPTALVQLLDYDQLFLKEQRAFETRLEEVAKEIAKREVDHAAWVDYIYQRAAFGSR